MFTILPSKCTRYTIIYMYSFYQLFTHLYLTIQHRKTEEMVVMAQDICQKSLLRKQKTVII